MLCVATLRLLVLQVAVLELPLPESVIAPQIVVLPSVKATVPVGALPATVAVKVTLAPTIDGLPELDSVVEVEVLPPIATDTVSNPDAPGDALMTLIVTPVVLST